MRFSVLLALLFMVLLSIPSLGNEKHRSHDFDHLSEVVDHLDITGEIVSLDSENQTGDLYVGYVSLDLPESEPSLKNYLPSSMGYCLSYPNISASEAYLLSDPYI